jgi:TonB family protein
MLPLTEEKRAASRTLDLKNASTIGRYRVLNELARRHATVVYKAVDLQHDRFVAVKVILADQLPSERLHSFREGLRHEASLVARLTDPGIVPILDSGEDQNGNPYIVMEFVEGETLEQALTSRKNDAPLTFGNRLDIAIEIARLLGHIHSRGVVHRDITPSNILLTEQFQVRIVDFGIATTIRLADCGSEILPGTPAFVAPELLNDSPANAQSDIFSLGVLLYWMFTGEIPFSGDTLTEIVHKVATMDPPPVRFYNWALPDEVDRVLGKCLAKSPIARYATARELERELAVLRHEMTSDNGKAQNDRQAVEEEKDAPHSISEPLRRELSRLRATYSSLAERLATAGQQFRDSELPISEDLVIALAEFKKDVADLSKMVVDLGKEISVADLPVGTLDDLRRSIEIIARAEKRRTQAIEAILENLGPVDRGIDLTSLPTDGKAMHAAQPAAPKSTLGLNKIVRQKQPNFHAAASSGLPFASARLRWVAPAIVGVLICACVAYFVMKSERAVPDPQVATVAAPPLKVVPRSDQPVVDPPPNLNVPPKRVARVSEASPEVRLNPGPVLPSPEVPSGVLVAPSPKQTPTRKGEPEPPTLSSGASSTSDRIGEVSANALAPLASPVPAPPPPPERIRIGGQLAAAKLVSQARLTYPPMARQSRTQGAVQLDAVIKKDGTVGNVVVISGPTLLRQAAIDAVKRWRYQPTLLNGQPIEVITNVNVDFRLGN